VNILAIRFARLGDVVLLLPALSSLKRSLPQARLTLLTGHRCAPIADLCPAIDEVLPVNRLAMRDGPVLEAFRNMAGLVRDVRRRRFDLVIDFHSFRETNLLAWLSGAGIRIAMKRDNAPYLRFCFNRPPILEDKSLHVAEMFEKIVQSVAGCTPSPSTPAIVIPDDLKLWAQQIGSNKLRLTLYIDAPVTERIWLPERFAALVDFAIEKLGALPIVISSKQGQDLAKRVQHASRNSDQIAMFTDISIPQMAALIASAHLFVSNDTGPMHIGPVVGVRTLGLFSVGYPEHFRPIGPNDRFLRANPIEKIETKDVIAAVDEMWAIADPGLRC
jgi:ADP-heptose:LPS heptosyltransferase